MQELLAREARSLVQRLRTWTPARFAAAAPPWGSRGDLVLHLAQDLADLAADLEGTRRRALPALEGELARPDQLAVAADDLVRAGPAPDVVRAAVCHLLVHREDLLGEPPPDGLAHSLDTPSIPGAGRARCEESGRSALYRAGRLPPGGAT